MIRHAHPDLQGLCTSPHDYPPSWAAMLTLYLDESLEQDEGYAIVAGFIGDDVAWNRCMTQWGAVLVSHGKTSLHLKSLRGWNDNRNEAPLRDLGLIPARSGLALFYAAVKFSDYSDLVAGTTTELVAQGYLVSLFTVVSMIILGLPEGERLEVIWEQLPAYSGVRDSMFSLAAKMPDWQMSDGTPKLAKWSSMAKSTILEPSDYASYALLQKFRDPNSKKSAFCAPILSGRRQFGWRLTREQIREGLTKFRSENSEAFQPMTREQKQEYRAAFKQVYRRDDDEKQS
jgi:hypothetical protein